MDEGWFADPFSYHEQNGRIYARGAIDNKGQVLAHMTSIFELIDNGKLQYNIKFIVEGNEETGSPNILKFLESQKELLAADFAMISDGELTKNHPTIELGLRGIINFTLTVRTAQKELHSGIYGGYAPNAVHELTKLLAKFYNEENTIAIPGFYDDVDAITEAEKLQLEPNVMTDEEFFALTTAKGKVNEPSHDLYLQTGLRPTLQMTGILAGYTGEGIKTSIPHEAMVKLNFRLVASQDPKRVWQMVEDFVAANLPDYVDFTLQGPDTNEGFVKAVKVDSENAFVSNAVKLLEQSYGKKVLFKYVGGTIPLVTHIHNELQIPQVIVPLANEDCNMHAVNENFNIELLQAALNFSSLFFSTPA
jgi:acetylornithine deacetylase/succinyl-diaminopimelate desuccinylase-like protein